MADPFLTIVDLASVPPGLVVTPNIDQIVTASRLGGGGLLTAQFAGLILGGVPTVIPLSVGPYVLVGCGQPAATVSPVYQVRATDGRPAPGTYTRRAVADRIRAIGLPGVAVEEAWNTSDVLNDIFPAVVLTVEGVSESEESRLSSADDIGYPVRVSIVDRADQYDADTLPDYEYWRWSIDKAFRNQQLPGVPESVYCKIEYDPIGNPNLPKFQYLVSEFVIRAVVRIYRGL